MNYEELQAARDAVVRAALNSTWNAHGGDEVRDEVHGLICGVAGCGLDQSILATIASWDSEDVFGKDPPQMSDRNYHHVARADAMITSLRRVVQKGLEDGVLKAVPASQRYSLGVTFADGREL